MQNDHYAHKIKEITSFKEDKYEILLYFNFYILLVEIILYLDNYVQKQMFGINVVPTSKDARKHHENNKLTSSTVKCQIILTTDS